MDRQAVLSQAGLNPVQRLIPAAVHYNNHFMEGQPVQFGQHTGDGFSFIHNHHDGRRRLHPR
ncbi:hypothetical protein D3C75_1013310 [compost metagenome]